jgi:hypothetical protein
VLQKLQSLLEEIAQQERDGHYDHWISDCYGNLFVDANSIYKTLVSLASQPITDIEEERRPPYAP